MGKDSNCLLISNTSQNPIAFTPQTVEYTDDKINLRYYFQQNWSVG